MTDQLPEQLGRGERVPTKPLSEPMPLDQLPADLFERVLYDVANFTIGFARLDRDTHDVHLIGSGTLVAAGGKRAILTAQHVVQALPKSGRIGLILGEHRQTPSIDAAATHVSFSDRGSVVSDGPDIALVTLTEAVAGTIEAKKSFYNVESRRDAMLTSPLPQDHGFWVAQGFVGERTIVVEYRPEGSPLWKRFFHMSAAGGPQSETIVGKYDYVEMPVIPVRNPDVPTSFGGMSGGGLWQIPLHRNAQGVIEYFRPLLSGVIFYQYDEIEQRHLKCHFRRTVYGPVLESLLGPNR